MIMAIGGINTHQPGWDEELSDDVVEEYFSQTAISGFSMFLVKYFLWHEAMFSNQVHHSLPEYNFVDTVEILFHE